MLTHSLSWFGKIVSSDIKLDATSLAAYTLRKLHLLHLCYREAPAVIASISARVGSVGDNNTIGGWYSYRASKTALNQLNKCMSIEVARKKQNVACIVLHPGTVDTDLSKPFQKATIRFISQAVPSL